MQRVEAAGMAEGWSREQLAEELSRPGSRVWVAEDGGRILGHAIAWVVADELHILDVCVLPGSRRQGLGRALVQRLLAEEHPALLEVRANNLPAVALYEGMGFVRVGLRKRYYDDGEDALLMTRELP